MITILDDTMRVVDILRKYEYSQYEYKAREIGTFTINAMLDKENLYLMDKTKNYYVLLDQDVFGIIESIKRESDSETSKVFTIKGSLALKLLEYRVINGQVTFKGKSYKYIEELVKQNLILSDDDNRNIALAVEFENEERLKQICSTVDKQVTGGSLWDEISEIAEADKLRILLKPNIVVVNTEHQQNIDGWTLTIGAGEDRTRHRTNKTVSSVVFSQSLSNIANTDYTVNRSKLRNTVYIAGEGEGADRKWYNIDVNSDVTFGERIGWNRRELWVDARDIQSEQDNKKLTDEEYEVLMKQRANEKAKDNDLSEEYTATVTNVTKQYTYKEDYNIGDFVTVADEELGMEIDAQITNIIVTKQNDRDIVDIEFTYGSIVKDAIEKSETAIKKIDENNVNVKYIEANTKKLEAGLAGVEKSLLGKVNITSLGVDIVESFTGQYLNSEPIYQKMISIGVLPNNTTKSVGTGISNANYVWIDTENSFAFSGGASYPIPYVDPKAVANSIGVRVVGGGATVVISTGADWGSYSGIVTLRYTKK